LSLATNIDVLTATGAGTYTLCSTTPTNLTTELKGTFFTPTALQVAPGHTMTTGISLAAIATVVRDHAR